MSSSRCNVVAYNLFQKDNDLPHWLPCMSTIAFWIGCKLSPFTDPTPSTVVTWHPSAARTGYRVQRQNAFALDQELFVHETFANNTHWTWHDRWQTHHKAGIHRIMKNLVWYRIKPRNHYCTSTTPPLCATKLGTCKAHHFSQKRKQSLIRPGLLR